jgi:hypothetical protein
MKGEMDDKELRAFDWIKAGAYFLLMVGVIVWGGFLMLPDYWGLWLVLTCVLVYSLIVWHTRHFDYRCPNCGAEYGIDVWQDVTGLSRINQQGGWKLLKCPKCKVRAEAKVIKKSPYSGIKPAPKK